VTASSRSAWGHSRGGARPRACLGGSYHGARPSGSARSHSVCAAAVRCLTQRLSGGMGGACARCNEITKGEPADALPGIYPELPESEESDDEGSEGNHSEIAASSGDDEEDAQDYKRGVADILSTTGQNLKRGKTMAMKEAIATAKKHGLESAKISEAEQRLTEHKKQQRRDEVEKEVEAFFQSGASNGIETTQKMVEKATEAECSEQVCTKLRERLDELIITRPLEPQEQDMAWGCLKQSCREFVFAATQGGGRQVILLDLEDGRKVPANISIDPPLQQLTVVPDNSDIATRVEVPIAKLKVGRAKDDNKIAKRKGFSELEEDDAECAVVIRYEDHSRTPGTVCLIEPTALKRDRLVEALLMLTLTCA